MHHHARFVISGLIFTCGTLVACQDTGDPSESQAAAAADAAPTKPSFIEFESGHVRPLAVSPDGTRLFAVNTPNNTLEIFSVTSSGIALQSRVPVGLEPVAVAARRFAPWPTPRVKK